EARARRAVALASRKGGPPRKQPDAASILRGGPQRPEPQRRPEPLSRRPEPLARPEGPSPRATPRPGAGSPAIIASRGPDPAPRPAPPPEAPPEAPAAAPAAAPAVVDHELPPPRRGEVLDPVRPSVLVADPAHR